jgi:hypothetical protein
MHLQWVIFKILRDMAFLSSACRCLSICLVPDSVFFQIIDFTHVQLRNWFPCDVELCCEHTIENYTVNDPRDKEFPFIMYVPMYTL